MSSDTIFALASAPGRAGVALVRVSGPNAALALRRIAGEPLPRPRHAVLRPLRNARGEVFDDALVLWFESPASFTGEDTVEFHLHGGRAVLEALSEALAALPGMRAAEPGEFSRRAVLNGKLDLTRAEAIADLVDAETEAQRRQALRQYEGGLAVLYDGWRDRLIAASAWTEASIDFVEEEIPSHVLAQSRETIAEVLAEMRAHLDDAHRGEIVRDGVRLAIIGPPNAGKSSLLNALAKRDVAIVSDIPGTTRDVLEVKLDLGGYPVIVSDTAGLRETADRIESEGVRRALANAERADLVLLVQDGSQPAAGRWPKPDLVVWNKADLAWPAPQSGPNISVATGAGFDDLLGQLAMLIREKLERPGEAASITRARHRKALEDAAQALARALSAGETELMAEDLRLAMRSLGRITGRVDIEDVLDVVFRDFCIGK